MKSKSSGCRAIIVALQVLFVVVVGYMPSAFSQNNIIELTVLSDKEDTASVWVSYGPKDTTAFSFWYEGQNGIKANWSLPQGYSLGDVRFPGLTERGDRQTPTFVFAGNSRILQQIKLPKGDVNSGASDGLIILGLTYGDCREDCIQKTGQGEITLAGDYGDLSDVETISTLR